MSTKTTPLSAVHVDALVRRLHRLGQYSVKSSSCGWWVDGRCGYLVAGYYDNKEGALINAILNIKQAKKYGRQPSWLYT